VFPLKVAVEPEGAVKVTVEVPALKAPPAMDQSPATEIEELFALKTPPFSARLLNTTV